MAGLRSTTRFIIAGLLTRFDRFCAQIWVRMPLGVLGAQHESPALDGGGYVAAVTSYPPRIRFVHLTIRSIMKQSLAADKIYLVLSSLEFPGGLADLPKRLTRLVGKSAGSVSVLFMSDNQRSYKKLLPVLELHPAAAILTADDDVIYTRIWAATLVHAQKRFPNAVLGTRGTQMEFIHRTAVPYSNWKPAIHNNPSHSIFLTGRGGILYPPKSLDARVSDWPAASRLCISADDVWFKAMSTLAGFTSVRIFFGRELPANGASQEVALWRLNQGESENDVALKKVIDHFDLWSILAAEEKRAVDD